MQEQKTMYRTIFINKSQYDGSLYGKMSWDGENYIVRNIDQNGNVFVGDVMKETGTTHTNKNGKEIKDYETIGAVRWNIEKGDGEYVTEMDGMTVKYLLTNKIEEGKFGPARVLRAKVSAASDNKFRKAFDAKDTAVVEGEVDESVVDDTIPY
ncbi:MAG: hypothetical protein II453_01865 [Alphaproteobacteria bacterium]|jgi:hypothetical protein|nr:hypothetical protein [Alphaproteobacteria bacterium]